MNNFEACLKALKSELLKQNCVQEYLYYKEIFNKDFSIKKLDEEVRFHQRLMCKNKDNDEIYFKEKAIYEELKSQFDNNPILNNYLVAKQEVVSLLVDIKNILI